MMPFIFVGGHAFASYGIAVATGMFVNYYILRADLRRRRLNLNALGLISAICVTGLICSKLYRILQWPGRYWSHPAALLNRSGFTFYGAVIGAVVVIILLARRLRVPAATLFDTVSAEAALGYGFGRLGCLLAGDGDYGVPTSLPWGMTFPHGLLPTLVPVHPTPIYEMLGAMTIAWYLWRLGSPARSAPPGLVFANYLLWTGIARFLVEFIRRNPRIYLNLSNAQWVALASISTGVIWLIFLSLRQRTPLPPPFTFIARTDDRAMRLCDESAKRAAV